jgi:hypothetical protein
MAVRKAAPLLAALQMRRQPGEIDLGICLDDLLCRSLLAPQRARD